jgi:hypothetical protein
MNLFPGIEIGRKRWEGSRLVVGQFYRFLRRRLPGNDPGRSIREPSILAIEQIVRQIVSGSRLLETGRTAALQSGSPPGAPPLLELFSRFWE